MIAQIDQRLVHLEMIDQQFSAVLADLDGTLVWPGQPFSEYLIDVFHRVTERGIPVILASARPPRSMWRYHRALGLSFPMITYNGALVVDPDGKALFRQDMPTAVAREVVDLIRRHSPAANVSIECDDVWHIDRIDADLEEALVTYQVDPPHSEGLVGQLLKADDLPVTKIVLAKQDLVPELVREFERAFPQDACLMHAGDLVEVVASGVSKGAAGAALCRRMGIASSAVVAFGNDYNDIPMLEFAGLSVVVRNAPEGVLEVADIIAPSCLEDGVAMVLELLLQRDALRGRLKAEG